MTTEASENKRMTYWRIKVITATWLSYAGFYFCRKAFGIVKPLLKSDYNFTDLELAHIWAAYLLAYMLGQFLTAGLGRKFACRSLLLAGMMGSLIVNGLVGFTITGGVAAFWWLLLFFALNGFAQSTGWPGNVGLLAKWSRREERGRLMAVWATCYMIGSILAKHFAALMLAWLGLAWSFWGASLILLAVWAIFYFFGQERPEDVGLSPLVEEIEIELPEGQEAPEGASLKGVFQLVIMVGLLYFCFKFMRYALDSWGPMLIKESFTDLSVATAGHLSTVFDWVGFLGVVVAGFASDKLFCSQRMPVVAIMTIGMCIVTGFWWIYGRESIWLFITAIGLIGFTMMGPDSLLSGTIAMDISTKEGAIVASGIINGLGSIGPIVQEEAVGYIKQHWGNESVFALLFGISLLAVVGVNLFWWRTRRRGMAL